VELRQLVAERTLGPQGETMSEVITRRVELVPLDEIQIDQDFPNIRLEATERELQELTESMQYEGLKQPITVLSAPPPLKWKFLRAGFRRTTAARRLGWQRIPAIVLPHDTPVIEEYWTNIVENSARQRLSTYEIALSAKTMRDRFGVRSRDFAKRAGYSDSYVENLLRCIDRLPEEILKEWRNRAPIPLDLYVRWSSLNHAEAVKLMISYCGRHSAVTHGWQPPSETRQKYFPAKMASQRGLERMSRLRFAFEVARKLDQPTRELCLQVIDFCTGAREDVRDVYDGKKMRTYKSRQKKTVGD
jgi:ParB/RepB/Spo0J family partition protein